MAHLLHDTSFSLGERDVATRLVGNELDLNLATLTATLLIIVVIVISDAVAWSLDAAALGTVVAIADGVRVVQVASGGLVVLISNIGHCLCLRRATAWSVCDGITKEKPKMVEMLD
jgi:hypothetical protein